MNEFGISQKAYEELKKNLNHLKTIKRKAIAEAIREAREHGDLKENSAYHEAKKEQSLNESRITDLENKLGVAMVVDNTTNSNNDVVMGSTVKIKNLKTKDIFIYTLVSELEANILEDKISASSPLGKAMLYHKVNETFKFNAPFGVMKYKVMQIS
ncbi:MAG: transcription elongation factor GreA [bacterium]